MFLYITSSSNENIFDKICLENNIMINKLNKVIDLNSLFHTNNNYTHYKFLAVDLCIISNTEDEIIQFFLKFRQLYDVKIIIVAIGRKAGDLTLSKLACESIFNFIISEDEYLKQEEIEACVLGNNGYKDCIKFKVLDSAKEIEKPVKSNKFKDLLDKINKSKIEKQLKEKPIKKEIETKIIEKETIVEVEKIVEKKVLVKPKIRMNKLKIAVCGTCPRMGTTTQAFLIVNYLIKYGFNACYIEFNNKNKIENIKNFYDVSIDEENHKINYKGVDIFYSITFKELPSILSLNYEVLVFDYGEFLQTHEESFASADFRIVVCGAKFWEEEYLKNVFKICNTYKDINFIFNFVGEEEQGFILKNMGELNVYFSQYCPNIFKLKNEEIYSKIFKKYLNFDEIGG